MASPTYLGSKLTTVVPPAPRAVVHGDWRKPFLIAAAVGVLAIPAVLLALQPKPATTPAAERAVVLSGPILGFEQSARSLYIRIGASGTAERRELIVRGAIADAPETIIQLKSGEARINVPLTPDLVRARSLEVIVQPRPASIAAAR